ncbi:MAG: M14 family metallopeptidase [Anaerolineaceae bacterium]
MPAIPATYVESRRCFRKYLAVVRRSWPSASLDHYALAGFEDLTSDWILADAQKRREKLLVISTGLHGIEGFIGSAVLKLFLDEFLGRLDPDTTGILFLHSLNPWGMKYWKRNNPNNVDLNRNFITGSFQTLSKVNPDYPDLLSFLCPGMPLSKLLVEKSAFIFKLVLAALRVGIRRVREAALMGQYCYPSGIYYGGQAVQNETHRVMDLYRDAFRDYSRIIHLDLHSGYGPRYQMTVVTSPHDSLSAVELKHKYQLDRVAGANPDEFYSIHGDMNDWEYELVNKEYPKASIFAANFEFGTYGSSILAGARSLHITILKNRKEQFGASKSAGEWVDREYRELYLPLESDWYDKVWQDARSAFMGILIAEGAIKK